MKRIFIKDFTQQKLKLDPENLHYLTKTLRFRGEEHLLVFDGEQEAKAIFNKDQTINILEITRQKESPFLKLAIAEIKKERLEWIVEKSTELGVSEIILLKTTRTQNFINIERINKIILSGCRQSSRISIPTLKQLSLNRFLEESVNSEWVYGSLQTENKKISETIIGAIIGPEGGWTEDEEEMLEKSFSAIYLNDNVLRSETAAITALNYIQYSKY